MKKSLCMAAIGVSLFFMTPTPGFAANDTVTLHGKAECAKCMLHETKSCQTVIQSEKNGKTVTYYLTDNDVAKNFHDTVCKKAKTVTATGTVKDEGGKMEFTATKIELAKE